MTVQNYYTNYAASPGIGEKSEPSAGAQELIRIVGKASVLAADDDGSTFLIAKSVPSSFRPQRITVMTTAITGGTDYELGLYNSRTGAVVSKGLFMTGQTLASASRTLDGLANVAVADIGACKTIAELLSLTPSTAKPEYDIVLTGAYVDTKFGDCTFQVSDFYEKEPVKLYASLVDLNGDPCEFETICVVTECEGSQAMGLGESVARDVILSESYRQNFFATDLRIREITQGTSVWNYIDRSASYTRYYIQHNVPRFNNPSSTFDNDQYLLEVITEGTITAFEDFVEGWLADCSQCSGLVVYGCETSCDPVIPVVTR